MRFGQSSGVQGRGFFARRRINMFVLHISRLAQCVFLLHPLVNALVASCCHMLQFVPIRPSRSRVNSPISISQRCFVKSWIIHDWIVVLPLMEHFHERHALHGTSWDVFYLHSGSHGQEIGRPGRRRRPKPWNARNGKSARTLGGFPQVGYTWIYSNSWMVYD